MKCFYFDRVLKEHDPKTPNTQVALDTKGELELQFLNETKTQILERFTLSHSAEDVLKNNPTTKIYFHYTVNVMEQDKYINDGICHSYDFLMKTPNEEQAKHYVQQWQCRLISDPNSYRIASARFEQISPEKALNRVKYYGREAATVEELESHINKNGYFFLLSEYED